MKIQSILLIALAIHLSLPYAHGATKGQKRLCPKLYAYIVDNAAIMSKTRPTPDKATHRRVEHDIVTSTWAAARAEAARLGLTPEQTKDAIETAGTMAGELFRNAVMWGNGFDKSKSITVELHATKDGIIISVQDEGTKPFDPLSDPGSFRDDETMEQHAERRKLLGKPLKTGETEGMYWTYVRGEKFKYGYHFDEGSTVIVNVPWTHKHE